MQIEKDAVILFLSGVVFGLIVSLVSADSDNMFGCSEILENFSNGTWNKSYINCATKPILNQTIIQNSTNITIQNFTVINQSDTEMYKEYVNMNWSFTRCTERLGVVEPQLIRVASINQTLGECVNELNITRVDKDTFQKKYLDEQRNKRNYTFLAVILALGGSYAVRKAKKIIPEFQDRQLSGTGQGVNVEAVNKDVKLADLEDELKKLKEKVGK